MLAQSVGFVLTAAGYVLGHKHKGRAFLAGPHGKTGNILFIPMALQLFIGIYLKLHIHEQSLRPWAVRLHGVVGKSYPILAWVQMLFGAIVFGGYCRGDNLGQCLAHYIMVRQALLTPLRNSNISISGEWVHRIRHHHGHSVARRRGMGTAEWTQSRLVGFMDHHALGEFAKAEHLFLPVSECNNSTRRESVSVVEGVATTFSDPYTVNTFTEHHGSGWSVKDMQHTYVCYIFRRRSHSHRVGIQHPRRPVYVRFGWFDAER